MRPHVLSESCHSDGPEAPDGMGTTCMLPFGHPQPCHYERRDQIRIGLADWVQRLLDEDDLPCEVETWP